MEQKFFTDTTCRDPIDTTLSQITQSQKEKSELVKFIGAESRMVDINGWRRKERELFKGLRVSVLQDGKISRDLFYKIVNN